MQNHLRAAYSVAKGVATRQRVWLVKGTDADAALYQIAKVIYMALQCLAELQTFLVTIAVGLTENIIDLPPTDPP